MGAAKALLPFGDETLLRRVVRVLSEVVSPIVVVAAADQELPALPSEVRVARDRHADRGPLEGIAVGLACVRDEAARAYVTACDTPLLRWRFVRRMIEMSSDCELTMLVVAQTPQPLAAVYATGMVDVIEELLASGSAAPRDLIGRVATRRVAAEKLADVDPELESLRNINTPDDYEAALATLGLAAPAGFVDNLKRAAGQHAGRQRRNG